MIIEGFRQFGGRHPVTASLRKVLAHYGYTFDDAVWARVADDLGAVVAGIRSGLYPNVTEPPKFEFYIRCHYCQPDGLGVDERWAEWSVKRHDERLRPWFDDAEDGGHDDA